MGFSLQLTSKIHNITVSMAGHCVMLGFLFKHSIPKIKANPLFLYFIVSTLLACKFTKVSAKDSFSLRHIY